MAKQKRTKTKRSTFRTHHKVLIVLLLVAITAFSFLTIGRIRAANLPSVQFIMFCATDSGDRCERNKNLNLLLAGNVREWYRRQTGGYSFRLLSPRESNGSVKVIYGSHDSAWYTGYHPANADYEDLASQNTFYNIYNEHVVGSGSDLSSVLLLGFSIYDKYQTCGLGAGGYHFGIVDATGSVCNDLSGKRMVMAHELAHTFDLNHVCEGSNMLMAGAPTTFKPNSPPSDADIAYINSCYDKGCHTIIRSQCSFTPDQVSQLVNSPFFDTNPATTGTNSVFFTQAQSDQP